MPGRSIRRRTWIVAIVAAVVIGVVWMIAATSPGRKFLRAYQSLHLGKTKDEVRGLFGPTPDFECRFRASDIWYYKGRSAFAQEFDEVKLERGATVDSLGELPDVHASVQLAFDAEGRLHAYTRSGESYAVESTQGSVDGSHFRVLQPSGF